MKLLNLFYGFKQVHMPGPGAAAYVYERAFYDPTFDPIGAGYGNRRQVRLYDGKPMDMGATYITNGLAGVLAGQVGIAPLITPQY